MVSLLELPVALQGVVFLEVGVVVAQLFGALHQGVLGLVGLQLNPNHLAGCLDRGAKGGAPRAKG